MLTVKGLKLLKCKNNQIGICKLTAPNQEEWHWFRSEELKILLEGYNKISRPSLFEWIFGSYNASSTQVYFIKKYRYKTKIGCTFFNFEQTRALVSFIESLK